MSTPPQAASSASGCPAPGRSPRAQRAWQRFVSWCSATDTRLEQITLDTLAEHVADMTGAPATRERHLRAVLHGLNENGYSFRAPRRGDLTADQALTRIHAAAHVWPGSFTARRDGFVLVARDDLHLPPERIANLTRDDVALEGPGRIAVVGRAVPAAQDHRACPACHVRTWLATLSAYDAAGRGGVHRLTTSASRHHQCRNLAPLQTMQAAGADGRVPFLPALDVYGWPAAALTARSIYRIDVARHCDAPAAELARAIAVPPSPSPTAVSPAPAAPAAPAAAVSTVAVSRGLDPRPPPGPSARRVDVDPDGHLDAALSALEDAVADTMSKVDAIMAALDDPLRR